MIAVLQRWDEALFRLINGACANPVGDALFPLFNHAAPFLLPALALATWLAWRNSPRAWKWALAIVLGMALADSLVFNPLKHLLARPRPAATLMDVRALASGAGGGWSLPSSHTANAFLAAAMLAAAAPRRRALWLSLAGAVGLARVYVGVHYPFDVAASALLGWGVGKGLVRAGRWSLHRGADGLSLPFGARRASHKQSSEFPGVGGAPRAESAPSHAWLHRHATPILLLALAAVQGARLLWAATTDLDVPVALAGMWDLARSGHAPVARPWFRAFGESSLSLWAIPWTFQTFWLAALAWAAFRRGGKRALAALALLAATVPLASQLSFSGSPALIFEDADWPASACTRALAFYALLGLPLWLAALAGSRQRPLSSALSLAGWVLGASFPHLPWAAVALLASGTMIHLSISLGARLGRLGEPGARAARATLTLLVAYGWFVSACVYSPRFLGKADLSLLPRNSPHYGQTGWREYCTRIRGHFLDRPNAVLWTADIRSKLMVRYYLGRPRTERVRLLEGDPPSPGDLWLREVDLAQINPRVLFVDHDDKVMRHWRPRMRELDSVEIFRKGDPIRQFQLWEFTDGKPSP